MDALVLTGIVVRETLQSFTEQTLALGMQRTVSGMVRKMLRTIVEWPEWKCMVQNSSDTARVMSSLLDAKKS